MADRFTIDLSPRTALITGGSRGIGRAVADLLAKAGARVAINYVRDEAAANRAVREIRAAGGEAMALAGDRLEARRGAPARARRRRRVGAARHPRQQRRHLGGGSGGRAARGRLGPDVRDQPARRLPRHGRGDPAPREDPRRDRLRLVHRRAARRGGALRLRRLEGRAHLLHEVARRGARPAGHPGQLRRPRLGGHRHVGDVPRRSERAAPRSSGSIPIGRVASPDDIAGPVLFLVSDLARHSRARSSTSTAGACWRAEPPAPMEKLDRRDLRFLGVVPARDRRRRARHGSLFRRAFPEASIEFRVNRGPGARRGREASWRGAATPSAGARFAGEFDVDETAKVYLERELGLEQAGAHLRPRRQGLAVADALVPVGRQGGGARRDLAARRPRSGSGPS